MDCDGDAAQQFSLHWQAYLSNLHIFGFGALMPDVTDCLPRTQLTDSLYVHTHQLYLYAQ